MMLYNEKERYILKHYENEPERVREKLSRESQWMIECYNTQRRVAQLEIELNELKRKSSDKSN